MSQFDSILSSMKNEPYSTKKQLLEYILHVVQTSESSKKALNRDDKAAILKYAYSEIDAFLAAIPNAVSYKEKDLIFVCENLVLGLIMQLCPTPAELPEDVLEKIKVLVELVAKEQYIETSLAGLFEQESIEELEVSRLLTLVDQTSDEYQKGMLYVGLAHYQKDISKFSNAAKARIADHIAAELKRYLDQESLDEDCLSNLAWAADISKYFANDQIVGLLYEVLKLGYSDVHYHAIDALFYVGQTIPADVILSLARNLAYANLTFALLAKYGKQEMFPKEYSLPEYLAKSNLVHWLMYPTELGKEPDEIVYIGRITSPFKKEIYDVFKYRSDSDTLGDDLKNKWLIGWSSDDGGAFSNFDEYALFEKESIDATLKNIQKKIIRGSR